MKIIFSYIIPLTHSLSHTPIPDIFTYIHTYYDINIYITRHVTYLLYTFIKYIHMYIHIYIGNIFPRIYIMKSNYVECFKFDLYKNLTLYI